MQNILLDLNLTDEQLTALDLHNKFKETYTYEPIKYYLKSNPDLANLKLQIWFSIIYNDNWHDVEAIYADVIQNDMVIHKIRIGPEVGIELRTYNGPEYEMSSFIITPKMID